MSPETIEALLFAAAKPMKVKTLAEFFKVSKGEIEQALEALRNRLESGSGTRLVRSGSEVQLMTSPDQAAVVRKFLDAEITGELTKPQLETLTVIAYREPISKPELEQIRGVNCGLILRNLLMRGLIDTEESREKLGAVYHVTHDFLRFLGITDVRELPDYKALRHDVHIESVLQSKEEPFGNEIASSSRPFQSLRTE